MVLIFPLDASILTIILDLYLSIDFMTSFLFSRAAVPKIIFSTPKLKKDSALSKVLIPPPI
ncbi:MAG: hypothetical protein Ct9H90mP2_15680 [Dehalococcoidia bacterium]|nr:MAG: hypothetical protein Ct9H90mP2_15680 [Dehalococcoidia bacterium]